MQKNRIKIISAIVTALVIFSLVGCGSSDKKYNESDFIGVWMAEKDIENFRQMPHALKYG